MDCPDFRSFTQGANETSTTKEGNQPLGPLRREHRCALPSLLLYGCHGVKQNARGHCHTPLCRTDRTPVAAKYSKAVDWCLLLSDACDGKGQRSCSLHHHERSLCLRWSGHDERSPRTRARRLALQRSREGDCDSKNGNAGLVLKYIEVPYGISDFECKITEFTAIFTP